MPVNLPTNLLRSFVAIVDAGSMLNATEHVFVTQSALSLQIRRLEEMVQQPLFTREGRRLSLTPAGTVMLDYARRVLSLHDEAIAALSAKQFSGPVRVGMVQDFADTLLAGVLGRFAELHPSAHIYARVAGTVELLKLLDRNEIDIIVGFAPAGSSPAILSAPMRWLGDEELSRREVVPLAVLEKPCLFRESAISSLEASGRRYRIAVETPNLSTLRAAVQARLGVTCRTHLFPVELPALPPQALPTLPQVACIIKTSEQLCGATAHLADLCAEVVRGLEQAHAPGSRAEVEAGPASVRSRQLAACAK